MTRRASTTMVGAGVISVVAIAIAVTSAQQPALAPAPFTTEQATAGRAAYTRECAGCHRPDLRGSGEASALSGPNFMSAWGDRSIAELYTRIQGSMPPGRAGALGDAEYLGIVATSCKPTAREGAASRSPCRQPRRSVRWRRAHQLQSPRRRDQVPLLREEVAVAAADRRRARAASHCPARSPITCLSRRRCSKTRRTMNG